jgi:two-component system, NtrC family, response regulator AtoC
VNDRVLVIDDEPVFRVLAEEALSSEGFEVRSAGTLRGAKEKLAAWSPDVVLLDRRLPDGDGIDFLKTIRADGASAPIVVIVTAYGDVANAVEALRAGAWDYLTKPAQLTDLVIKLRKVLETRSLRDRLSLARTSAAGPPMVAPKSPNMREAIERLRQVSVSRLTPVFLLGRSGVGKQFAAELLHAFTFPGAAADAPFVEVNCAALPDDLVESELFGHEKGAFTDAKTMRRGLIQLADGGTLFLDEVTELPLRSQAKLLKFIDTMRFRRLGGESEIAVELRLVAATNRDVLELVRAGRLREDLYHRLAVFSLAIPPLAERREDIADLATAFARFFAARTKKRVRALSPGAVRLLVSYGYPGNVRELRNIVERAVILANGEEITEHDIMLPKAEDLAGAGAGFCHVGLDGAGRPPPLEAVERAYVARVLEHCEGRRSAAVETLSISYPTFLKWLRELGLDSPSG